MNGSFSLTNAVILEALKAAKIVTTPNTNKVVNIPLFFLVIAIRW